MGFFFFSSRRRHTRWPRDWSSDVCSSDLDLRARAGKLASSTTGTSRVWALTLVLAAVGVVLAAIEWPAGRPADSPPGISVPWWLLAAIFYVTEAKVVH